MWPTSPSWLKGPKSPYRGAVSGGSGGCSFGLGGAGAGKAGVAAFVGSPWQGPATAPPVRLGVVGAPAAAAAAPATPPAAEGAAGAAAAGQGGFWNLASLQQRLQSLGLAGVMAYGEPWCAVLGWLRCADLWGVVSTTSAFSCWHRAPLQDEQPPPGYVAMPSLLH